MNSKLKRLLKDSFMRLPFIKKKKDAYIQSVRAAYDFSAPGPSILCSTCIGGMIYHNLGLRFLSPTINLWMIPRDLVKLVTDLDAYREAPLRFVENSGYDFPVADIGEIRVYFQHYTDPAEAEAKWHERFARIDRENMYVITDDTGLTEADVEALLHSGCKRAVIFTCDPLKGEPYFCYACYAGQQRVGKYSVRALNGFAPFEKEFDYAAWLNGQKMSRR